LSENVHTTLQEANEINESASRGNRIVPVFAAVFAVLAALGTLASHHRSIIALNVKNEAILTQARATDRFNAYESKSIRYNIFQALLAAGLPAQPDQRTKLQKTADDLYKTSLETQTQASILERQSADLEDEAERALKSYETLEIGTTFCEVSIVIVSISALSDRSKIFVIASSLLSGIGIVFLVVGFFQGH
jgi:hypothetical protein